MHSPGGPMNSTGTDPRANARIVVEVVFALPDRQALVAVELPAGATVAEAIAAAGLAGIYEDQDIANAPVAIWAKPVGRSAAVSNGDRIEILRPLRMDPRDARREVAKVGGVMSGSARPGPPDEGDGGPP